LDEYQFPGFRPKARIKGIFGDPRARVITLGRSQKKRYAVVVVPCTEVSTTRGCGVSGIYRAGRCESIWRRRSGVFCAGDTGR